MPLAAFIVPASAVFRVHDGHVAVSYPGDVRIEQDFSGELSADGNVEIVGTAASDITAGGDLAIHDGASGGTLRASGSLIAAGDVHATGLFADVIDLRSATSISATSIRATTAIHIGPCDLKVDIVMAPIVHIHSAATGKITLLECHNPRETLKVKGCLSLADYENLMSDALGYLAERGVEPLPPARAELPQLPAPDDDPAMDQDEPLPDLSLSMEPLDLDDEPAEVNLGSSEADSMNAEVNLDELDEQTHEEILHVVDKLDSIEPAEVRARAKAVAAQKKRDAAAQKKRDAAAQKKRDTATKSAPPEPPVDLDEAEDLEELQDVEDLNEAVDLDDAEEIEELNEAVDLDDAEEVEDLNEVQPAVDLDEADSHAESDEDPDTAQNETVDDPPSEDEDVDDPELILDPRVESLREAFAEVHAAYDRRDLARPAALAAIQVAAQVGDVRAVSDTLDASWMDLLAYHQSAGLQLPPRVVVVFQRIRALMAA